MTRDLCSRNGAILLARKIELYWAQRGRVVTCRFVTFTQGTENVVYGVRSDLDSSASDHPVSLIRSTAGER